jgi:hypothetical protein
MDAEGAVIRDISKAISILFQPGQLVEIRGKFREGGMASLYFTDLEKMGRVLDKNDQSGQFEAIWYTLQRLKPGTDKTKDPGKATSRDDILSYEWLVIDIDRPRKPKGTKKDNATDDDLLILGRCRNKVHAWLRELGWPEPVVMCSGNGFHLLYKLDSLPTSNFSVLKDTLSGIAYHFRDIAGDEKDGKQCNIDESLSEPEQIIKAYGTWSRLSDFDGQPTPWRESHIVSVPKAIKAIGLGDCLAAQMELPRTSAGKSSTGKGRPYNQEWMENYGVADLFDWAVPYLELGEEFEENGETYYPSSNCPIHAGEDGMYQHSGQGAGRHYAIIVNEKDQTIRNNCFSGELSLGKVIAKINKLKGEKYPHLVFAEMSVEDELEEFGAEIVGDLPIGKNAPETGEETSNTGDQPSQVTADYLKRNADAAFAAAGKEAEPSEPESTPELKGFDLIRREKKGGGFTGLHVICIDDSPDRPIDWLWPERIPAGVAFTISGPIGVNKSMALLDIAARISNGADWPDGAKNELGPRKILICATEDELETIIRPRLRAAGANLKDRKIFFLENVFDVDKDGVRTSRTMDLEKDTQSLYAAVKADPEILLVILDPVTGYYGSVDPNDNKNVRKMVTKISRMCMLSRVAVACIIHENKKSDVNVVDKMAGASSMSQVIRAGMRFSFGKEKNERVMASLKLTGGKRGGGMKFKVEQTTMLSTKGEELKDIGYVVWGETHEDTADEVREQEQQEKAEAVDTGKTTACMKIMIAECTKGRQLQRDVHRIIDQWERDNGQTISPETRKIARRKAGIMGSQGAPWYWWLPGKEGFPDSKEQKMRDEEAL